MRRTVHDDGVEDGFRLREKAFGILGWQFFPESVAVERHGKNVQKIICRKDNVLEGFLGGTDGGETLLRINVQ